jgi:hypothetical protein
VTTSDATETKQKGTSFGRDQFEFRKRLIIAATIHLAVAVAARDAFTASLRAPWANARVSPRQSV